MLNEIEKCYPYSIIVEAIQITPNCDYELVDYEFVDKKFKCNNKFFESFYDAHKYVSEIIKPYYSSLVIETNRYYSQWIKYPTEQDKDGLKHYYWMTNPKKEIPDNDILDKHIFQTPVNGNIYFRLMITKQNKLKRHIVINNSHSLLI